MLIQPYILEDETALNFKVESEDIEETIRDIYNKNDKAFAEDIVTLIRLSKEIENLMEDHQENLLKE